MTDKELRKLRRDDLLQILIKQQRENDELNAELAKAREALEDRRITIGQAGSLAEATLKLNGVFEAAQAAADQYVDQVKVSADEMRAQAQVTAEQIVNGARSEAERILRQAREEAALLTGVKAEPVAQPEPQEAPADTGKRRGLFGRNRKA